MPEKFDQPFFTLPEILANWATWQPEKLAAIATQEHSLVITIEKREVINVPNK